MGILFNVFMRTLGFFLAILLAILIIIGISAYTNYQEDTKFDLVRGSIESSNTIFILEINGPIIQSESSINDLVGMSIISPEEVKNNLDKIMTLNPNILIVSINSPGGTVSASNELYNHFEEFKKKSNSKIYFHSSEMLASGGYWSSLAGEKIYANYGAIIGSIGVKGPDWFFYDKPNKISTGIFGQTIETKNSIKIFSNSAGKSKDILNPFRKPTQDELDHLKIMVQEIYSDFIRIVSKERKIETNTLINEIGAYIYNSKQATKLHLINSELSIDELIIKKTKKRNLEKYKVIKKINAQNSFIKEFLIGKFYSLNNDIMFECLSLRSSISVILNYESTGC